MEKQETLLGLKRITSKVSADNADDLIFRNHALLELGQLYVEKCDFPNALEYLEKVKTEALQFHLYDNYFKAMALLLRIHAERLEFEQHESLMREVLHVGESLASFQRYQPRLHYNQAIAYSYKQQWDDALNFFQLSEKEASSLLEAASEKERLDLQRERLNAKYGVAFTYKDKGQYDHALKLLQELHQEIQSQPAALQDLEANVMIVEGHCHRELKQYQSALDKYWAAHSILKNQRNWSHYYYVLLGLGRTYLMMDDVIRANTFFELVKEAVSGLELNALKRLLERVTNAVQTGAPKLLIDRERKVLIEKQIGEVHFERRFVLLEILYLLASEPGRIFTKEDLVDRIWRESYNPMIHDSKVYTSISRLRKLIEPDFKRPRYILNERDGYAFNPNVQLEEVSQSRGYLKPPVRREMAMERGLQ